MSRGVIIAAPNSGAGKTMVTLGLLRALKNAGVDVSSAKSGPDYIDPAFHHAATGKACVNLDAWAMDSAHLRGLAHRQTSDLLLIEGAMGLFDGALAADNPLGKGSVADLAVALGLPVVLVLDASKLAQTAAAIVVGLAGFRDEVNIAGVILNKVGSAKHHAMLRGAIEAQGFAVLGSIPRTAKLQRPSRHLGLVQALEDPALENFIADAAELVAQNVDLARFQSLSGSVKPEKTAFHVKPLGQRISIARDAAFAFSYPHQLTAWQDAGAEPTFFTPLNNEAPDPTADAVFLPGGYPELYAGRLAAASKFIDAMRGSTATIYGECGGYMVLGESLTDAKGRSHKMLGLLPVSTSFAQRKLHLGYRNLTGLAGPFKGQTLKAHEFHYATITAQSDANHLFSASNSLDQPLGPIGHVNAKVSGSFAHIIC